MVDNIRATPYIKRPTDDWVSIVDSLNDCTLFLVARHGPTVFGLKDENDKTIRVTLGNPHRCNCGQHKTLSQGGATCVHRLFCLIKVLKVPVSHPLSYQTSLTDAELDQVLSGLSDDRQRNRRVERIMQKNKKIAAGENSEANSKVPRQPLSDDQEETCPICQDEMKSDQALSWCRQGCGNNVHAKCMMKYTQYKVSHKQDPSCPLCRELWDLDLLKLDCRGNASMKNSYAPIVCSSCRCLQRNDFYRCVECSQLTCSTASGRAVDFCAECFQRMQGNTHLSHHFLMSEAVVEPTDRVLEWTPVLNPLQQRKREGMGNLSAEAVLALQSRELDVNDYEMLLQLDAQPTALDLPNLCVQSLPRYDTTAKASKAKSGGRCWCHAPVSPARDDGDSHATSSPPRTRSQEEAQKSLRKLPCGHVVHDACLLQELRIIASDDSGKVADYRCEHRNCGKRIFISLSRKRRRKAPPLLTSNSSKSLTDAAVAESAAVLHSGNGGSLNIVGNNFAINNTASSDSSNPHSRYSLIRREQSADGADATHTAFQDSSVSNNNNFGAYGGNGTVPDWVHTDRLDPMVYGVAPGSTVEQGNQTLLPMIGYRGVQNNSASRYTSASMNSHIGVADIASARGVPHHSPLSMGVEPTSVTASLHHTRTMERSRTVGNKPPNARNRTRLRALCEVNVNQGIALGGAVQDRPMKQEGNVGKIPKSIHPRRNIEMQRLQQQHQEDILSLEVGPHQNLVPIISERHQVTGAPTLQPPDSPAKRNVHKKLVERLNSSNNSAPIATNSSSSTGVLPPLTDSLRANSSALSTSATRAGESQRRSSLNGMTQSSQPLSSFARVDTAELISRGERASHSRMQQMDFNLDSESDKIQTVGISLSGKIGNSRRSRKNDVQQNSNKVSGGRSGRSGKIIRGSQALVNRNIGSDGNN